MLTLLLVIHVIISVALIAIVVMQKSEGGASLFSGGAERVMKGATYNVNSFLTKLTSYLVVAFFVSSITLAIVYYSKGNFSDNIADSIEKTLQENNVDVEGATENTANQESGDAVPTEY